MAETILCYGIKSRFGSIQVQRIEFVDLGKSGYDYQIALKRLSEEDGFGSFDLILYKDGKEVECLELEGWKFQKLHIGYDWGGSWFLAEATDSHGETGRVKIAGGGGSRSPYQPTPLQLIRQGFEEMKKILTTCSSISMYNK